MMMMNMVLAMFQWCFSMRSTTQLDGVAETDVAVHMLKPCMSSTTDFMSCSCLDTVFSTFMFCCSLPRIMMTFCPVKTEKRMIPRSPITSTTSFRASSAALKHHVDTAGTLPSNIRHEFMVLLICLFLECEVSPLASTMIPNIS